MVELGHLVRFIDYRGRTPTKTFAGVPLITAKNVKMGYINREPREFIANADYKNWMTRGIPKKGDVLFTTEAPLGNVAQIDTDERIALAQRVIDLQPSDSLNSTFLKLVLMDDSFQGRARSQATGSTAPGIKASYLKQLKIPLPSLKTQNQIVGQIEEETQLIEANKKLVENFEKRLQVKLAEIWSEESTGK